MTYRNMEEELLKMRAVKECRRKAPSYGWRRPRRKGSGNRTLYVKEADDGYEAEEISSFLDYESCRDKLTFRLGNYGMLQSCLSTRIHRRVMDLAAVYYCSFGSGDAGSEEELRCVTVKKRDLERWGITEEELHQDAVRNASRIEPPVFLTVDKMVEQLFYPEVSIRPSGICRRTEPEEEQAAGEGIAAWQVEEVDWSKDELPELFVLTNRSQMYGAAAMLYSGLLRSIAEHFQDDLTIIPSSVHEVLLLPSGSALPDEELGGMILEVNESCLRRNEILSDRPYHYSRRQGTLC